MKSAELPIVIMSIKFVLLGFVFDNMFLDALLFIVGLVKTAVDKVALVNVALVNV